MRVVRHIGVIALAAVLAACGGNSGGGVSAPEPDQFQWLEDVGGQRSMDWVKQENGKTVDALKQDSRFAPNYELAKAFGGAPDRIPAPAFIGGMIYNFWQDAQHVRGIWRKTTQASYESPQPAWTTVLDLDELARAEGKNWAWGSVSCNFPADTRCLIALSEGGGDAKTIREFDLTTMRFVPDGFALPAGKQNATWLDDNTLLVSREWNPGEVTASGYAYIVKKLRRGQPLAAAEEVFRGNKNDISVSAGDVHDSAGHRAVFLTRGLSFFEAEYRLLTPNGAVPLALPKKSSISDLVDNRLLVTLDQDWSIDGTTFKAGSLVALDLAAVNQNPARLRPALVYAPGPRETLGGVNSSGNKLAVTSYHNVRGRAALYTAEQGGKWSSKPIDVPDFSSVSLSAVDPRGSTQYATVTSFLSPPQLWKIDLATGKASVVKTVQPKFDASGMSVRQLEATSTDGTKVPYFVVSKNGLKQDGSSPTLMTAYGGFGNAMTPSYGGTVGKLWLERGGVYVLANIRGGGEFGPAWHDAGLKTQRQKVFDDFAAVAKDLIANQVTSPRRLGIEGGSNGGLLMGVQFTQHPELWNAVEMAVPLLDMLRYEQIAAGASWVGEYGSVTNPAEKQFLQKISPYHNLKPGVKYPVPFIQTTTKDDRVGPQHARKFAARLASLGYPYHYYEVTEGGHGAGVNIDQRAYTAALEYTYFMRQLFP